jgi:hypothetical protein
MLKIIQRFHISNAVIAIIGCFYALGIGEGLWALSFLSSINTSLLSALLIELTISKDKNNEGDQ